MFRGMEHYYSGESQPAADLYLQNRSEHFIEKLLQKNGGLDITSYIDSEAGTDHDGNPDGYDQLSDNQTPDGEVSEQDPPQTE